MPRLLAFLCGCALLVSGARAAETVDGSGPAIRSELRSVVLHLVDLTLSPGQAGRVDGDHVALVPLTSTNVMGDVRRSTGAVVPYVVEGPGSFTGFYVALCEINEADPQIMDYDQAWHPDVRLLAFAQFDNHVRAIPRWAEATVQPGLVIVPVEIENCGERRGVVSFHVNGNFFGPNILMTRDAGAMPGPDACVHH